MKKILVPLLLAVAAACAAVPLTLSGSPLDLSYLPKYFPPFRAEGSVLKDAEGKRVAAAGTNKAGYGNLPTSMAQANSWTLKDFRLGSRVNRSHHTDVLLFDHNWDAHKPRLDILVSSYKKRGIGTILEISSQRVDPVKIHAWDPLEWDKWRDQARRLLTHVPSLSNLKPYAQEPYIVGIVPMNEDCYFPGADGANTARVLQEQISFLRSLGYQGLIWGANAGIPEGWVLPGDVEGFHRYTDHPYSNLFWNTKEIEQPWNWYRRKTAKPLVNTELGALWPSKTRGESEASIVDHAVSIGCQIVMPFALVTRPECWDAKAQPLEQYSFHSDPARVSTVRYAALKLQGWGPNLVYVPPDAQNGGFSSELVSDGVKMAMQAPGGLPVIEKAPSKRIQLPAGKKAWALDTMTGKKLYELPIETIDGIRHADTATAWTAIE